MKYYSETLNKLFDTEDELADAEVIEEERRAKEKKEKEKKDLSKREAAKKVENASILLDKAYDDLDDANKLIKEIQKETADKVNKILDEFEKKKREILDKAKKNVSEAQDARREALAEFNSKYGQYSLQGKEASKEINRFNRLLEHFWDTLTF